MTDTLLESEEPDAQSTGNDNGNLSATQPLGSATINATIIEEQPLNADSPIPGEILFASITHPKKRQYLEKFMEFGTVTGTARAVGVAYRTPYDWKDNDPDFKAALAEVRDAFVDTLEKELYNRAIDRKAPMSTIALLAALKAERPDKYREKAQETRLTGDITIIHKIPDRDYTQVSLVEPLLIEGEGETDTTK